MSTIKPTHDEGMATLGIFLAYLENAMAEHCSVNVPLQYAHLKFDYKVRVEAVSKNLQHPQNHH